MKISKHAGIAIAPAHLCAGFLFALLPASPYQQGYYAGYGAILVVLAGTLMFYGWAVRAAAIGPGLVCLQVLAAAVAAAVPLFLVDFSDPWHAIVYLPILGASLLLCLVVGLLARFFGHR